MKVSACILAPHLRVRGSHHDSCNVFCYFACAGGNKMNTTEDQDEAAEPPAKVKSVSATLLGEFFESLEEEEGFGEIAPRLRKVVLEDGVFAEPAIRAALFPDAS